MYGTVCSRYISGLALMCAWLTEGEVCLLQNASAAILAMWLIVLSRLLTSMLMAGFNHNAPLGVKCAGFVIRYWHRLDASGNQNDCRRGTGVIVLSCEQIAC